MAYKFTGYSEPVARVAVSAEVKTDKRRLIEFVMAPLMRYSNESARER